MEAIYIVDVILLTILCLLIVFMCAYGVYCVYRLTQGSVFLRPTRVVFADKTHEGFQQKLSIEHRTVVAYQNPLTGEYCVHKPRVGVRGHDAVTSPGSEHYEPLRGEGGDIGWRDLHQAELMGRTQYSTRVVQLDHNTLNKTWNWNYKEYQI